jgi:hypothetical protein
MTLWSWGQRRAEIWFCGPNYEIKEHRHPNEDIEIMYLFGSANFYRRDINTGEAFFKPMTWRSFMRKFTINNFHVHWFSVGRWPMIVISFQRFLKGAKPVSAASDFLTQIN